MEWFIKKLKIIFGKANFYFHILNATLPHFNPELQWNRVQHLGQNYSIIRWSNLILFSLQRTGIPGTIFGNKKVLEDQFLTQSFFLSFYSFYTRIRPNKSLTCREGIDMLGVLNILLWTTIHPIEVSVKIFHKGVKIFHISMKDCISGQPPGAPKIFMYKCRSFFVHQLKTPLTYKPRTRRAPLHTNPKSRLFEYMKIAFPHPLD